jgi:hypothetical protein
MTDDLDRVALVVVDAQQGFDDAAFWGRRNNPDCDDNIRALVERWAERIGRWSTCSTRLPTRTPRCTPTPPGTG